MTQPWFQKFASKKKNSAIKEEFRQLKKKAKKARQEAINKRFEERRQVKASAPSSPVKKEKERQGTRTSRGNKAQPNQQLQQAQRSAPEQMPLNKFLAHCGISSRRDAVNLIKEGKVKVNEAIVTEPSFKVNSKDEVKYNGKRVYVTKNIVYILLNKPKDYLTTTEDPQGRKTVLQLTAKATSERIYPIGRLDRNTSGVLLLTNDGELTQKLSHPSYNIAKVYEVKLDKPLTKADFDKILNGIKLEDGIIKADSLAYADASDKSVIGIEIHSGRNRIVRRIFEHLGYDVKGLDRVMYGTLTKKNLPRGKWRFLSEKEIRILKYLNSSRKQKPNHA